MVTDLTEYKFKTEPFKHQLDALAQSAGKRCFAYFMEMGCVDGETEFLTQRGWVRFKDFDLEKWERPLLVAQALPKTFDDMADWSLEFVEPISFIKKPAYDWISLNGITIGTGLRKGQPVFKFRFTADHVLPIKYNWSVHYHGTVNPRSQIFFDSTAEYIHKSIHNDPTRVPKLGSNKKNKAMIDFVERFTGGLKGFDSEYFKPDPELNSLTEGELRFMVAVMADGTFPNKYDNKVDFYFVKEHKVKRLQQIAAQAGIPLIYEKVQRCRPYITEKQTIHILHAIAPIREKIYTNRWYSLPYDKLRIIASEVFRWDGWICADRSYFYTIEKESADFIQYCLAACGWAASISYDVMKKQYTVRGVYTKCRDKRLIADFDPTYAEVTTSERDYHRLYGSEKEPSKEETCYCFRVPSGYLVLRRDNQIFVSGNSGKTKVMLDNIGFLYQKKAITGALILAPKGVYRNWASKEIPTHFPDNLPHDILVWDASSSAGKKDKLSTAIKEWDGTKLQFLVFNIESLISEKGRKLIVDFIKRHNGNVLALVDESTCIKNHKAKRTKTAIEIGQKCKVRRIATGSPITNSPLDLYSQCAFLDKALLGFGSYYSFKNTYADIERIQNRQGQSYEKILRYKNLDQLSDKIGKFSYRITKQECLDLPDKVYVTRDVELTPMQKEIYKNMYDNQFATLIQNNKYQEMSTQVILTKFLRLHQILCGTFTSDDGQTYPIENNRVDALKEVLEETSGKIIIWATYLENIYAIADMLTKEYGADSFVTYYGATSSEDRIKAIELFQDKNNSIRFFLGNVQTAGRGITLTAASTVVYFSNNFSLELRQQSEDRAHRLGQENKVTYIDLVVRNSLDEKIIRSLIEKRNIANEVLKDDLTEWISLKTV